jgi:hypothetical protein
MKILILVVSKHINFLGVFQMPCTGLHVTFLACVLTRKPEPLLAFHKPSSVTLAFTFRAVYSAVILNDAREGLARTIQFQYSTHLHPSLPEDLLAMVKLINGKLIGNAIRSCS